MKAQQPKPALGQFGGMGTAVTPPHIQSANTLYTPNTSISRPVADPFQGVKQKQASTQFDTYRMLTGKELAEAKQAYGAAQADNVPSLVQTHSRAGGIGGIQ